MKTKFFRSLAIVILALLVAASASAFEPAPINIETEKDVPTGATINISAGNCGAAVINAPEEGTLILENNITPVQAKGLKFYKKACELTYEDADGIKIASTKGAMVNFINLTKEERALWDGGELGFSVYDGNTWSACTPYFASAGEYGRLACWTHTVGTFGVVDLREKAAEDEEEKEAEAKKPEGHFVVAGTSHAMNAGRCGVYLPSIPVTGYCDLENGKQIEHVHGLRFVQQACELSYTDEAGFDITTYKGSLQNTINLTPALSLLWQEGDLAMYVLDGKTWKPCETYWVDAGKHGRLACPTDNVGKFSLVDISVQVEEDEED